MKITTRILSLLSGLLTLASCSGADLLNAIVPHSGYTLHKDIAYGDNPRQKLDIYVPDGLDAPAPVIVFFYGGSWQNGDKKDYRFVGQAFASRGYVAVLANYRLYPEVSFPQFVRDGASAVTWTHEHIEHYQGDAKNLFLAGHSAGGYIAAMLAIDPHYLADAGGKRAWVRGAIGIAGPYDFLPMTDPKIIALFSTAKDVDTQPITFVKSGVPPMLLLTGDADVDVYPRNSQHLAAKLEKFRDPMTLKVYPGVAHIGIILSLADGFRNKSPALQDIDDFIRQTRKPQK